MLAAKVEDMINTVVRQIAFYTFERAVHTERKSGELTAERIGELWLDVQRESLGPAIELKPGYETFWAYIPHFIHSPFYVYAYAFGDCLVNSLYAVYEHAAEGFAERYLAMLSAGGTKHHSELLAPFGLDARDPAFWQGGLGRDRADDCGAGKLGLTGLGLSFPVGIMPKSEKPDREKNRFSARAARYARVGANVGGVAARYAGRRLLGGEPDRAGEASALSSALGRLKGPLMKVAQLMATIPDLLPPEYAAELQKLQSEAPPMGWAFVKRRMMAELGADWEKKFASFEHHPAAAASLGQVHRARSLDGAMLACKLQYPDMQSAVEADLQQLQWLLAIRRRLDSAIDTSEIGKEIGARVREELDYRREAKHVALYREMLDGVDIVRVPRAWPELSTGRLLTLDWLDGSRMLAHKNRSARGAQSRSPPPCSPRGGFRSAASASSTAIRISAITRSSRETALPAGINLLDYGCIRIFPPKFVRGVVDLYHGLLHGDDDLVVHAYETWGFRKLSRDLIDTLNIWARFIYAPLLDDRVRTIADGVKPSEYGRREAFRVHQALKQKGPVTVPREFVFMDRAAIGLGAVFLHLRAELNFYRLFNEAIERFSMDRVAKRQAAALAAVGLAAHIRRAVARALTAHMASSMLPPIIRGGHHGRFTAQSHPGARRRRRSACHRARRHWCFSARRSASAPPDFGAPARRSAS